MRRLEVIDGSNPHTVGIALRAALSREGPAILPRERAALGETALGSDAVGGDVPAEIPLPVALVVETSGSSGAPKRVALSADALLASAAGSESALGGPGQWLLTLPTHYVAGIQVLVRGIAAGTTPVVAPAGRFTAQGFAAAAAELEHPVRYTSIVPVQLARLVEAAEREAEIRAAVARFDAILVGGQALAPALADRAHDLGFRVVRTYGSSETAGGCVYDGSPIGRTIVRERGGELQIAGPSLAEGYLDEALTAERFIVDDGLRWYRTGDAGSVAGEGDAVRVQVTGRLDNVIISGGVKVALDRVERLVQAVPGFEQGVVVARDDDEWGQVPVVVTDARVPTGALWRLRDAVAEVAGRAAAPDEIVEVERLPRLASGKPDRVGLTRLLAVRDHAGTPPSGGV
ncbi:AMP-binding protein [Cnuibacter sp. UC19_7]|uniref:AMP-binding protein n=1 Tax=Cnuibacter sp. UC19_7 TaxID=3350166 RepID=UPI00367201F8